MNSSDQRSTRDSESRTGSRKNGEPEFVLVGIIRRPHGIYGEVLVEPQTDFPATLQAGVHLFLGEGKRPVTIRSRREHNGILLAFDQFNSREDWGDMRNQLLFRRASESPALPKGSYYHHELVGAEVISEDGGHIGVVDEILKTGANQIYLVKDRNGKEILIPSVSEFVREINLEKKQMVVRLLPGMHI